MHFSPSQGVALRCAQWLMLDVPLQRQVWLLLSAILWLGDIEFDSAGDDSVTVRRDEALANAAELLNLDEDELATALSERVLTAGPSLSLR